ncbi:MAG TPA: hypothetical protein VMU69_31740 [Bradyrhizobium sp.]|nr:hypothetical protein [Bradyrhizobium sp.]
MVMVARRLRAIAARRATEIAARGYGVSRSGAGWREMLLRGCGKGKALESKQPCQNARDHRAGQTPSFWGKLYHVRTEPLLTVQIRAKLRDTHNIPQLLPNWHATDVPISRRKDFRVKPRSAAVRCRPSRGSAARGSSLQNMVLFPSILSRTEVFLSTSSCCEPPFDVTVRHETEIRFLFFFDAW